MSYILSLKVIDTGDFITGNNQHFGWWSERQTSKYVTIADVGKRVGQRCKLDINTVTTKEREETKNQ
jgi:hypothetical protein